MSLSSSSSRALRTPRDTEMRLQGSLFAARGSARLKGCARGSRSSRDYFIHSTRMCRTSPVRSARHPSAFRYYAFVPSHFGNDTFCTTEYLCSCHPCVHFHSGILAPARSAYTLFILKRKAWSKIIRWYRSSINGRIN